MHKEEIFEDISFISSEISSLLIEKEQYEEVYITFWILLHPITSMSHNYDYCTFGLSISKRP